jgi:hypothetical protein
MTADNLHTLPKMKELADIVMTESQKIFDAYESPQCRRSLRQRAFFASITTRENIVMIGYACAESPYL